MNPDSDNHLGSSTFLTDAAGEPYQFVMYLPFGETFTEQRAAGFGTPYLFNAKELDEETGLYYYGARYGACPDKLIGNPRVSMWWGVDPLAGDYPSHSPYAYVANNPLKYIDPDGRKIVNPYEKYSQYSGLEQQLRSNIANASSSSERRIAKRELKANRDNIQGFKNYQEVQGLLSNFKQANESEYNRVDNLQLNGVVIDVVVGLNNNYKGDIGQVGETNYSYGNDPETFKQIIEFQTGDSYLLPTKIENNNIDITLYLGGRNLNTLANEFGDAIFGVENPAASYRDTKANVPYLQKSSTRFSFDYEDFIIKGGTKPDPKEY